MSTDLIKHIQDSISQAHKNHTTFTHVQILSSCFTKSARDVLHDSKNKDLKTTFMTFIDHICLYYRDVNMSDVLENDLRTIKSHYVFSLYSDSSPHTIIPLLIFCICNPMDNFYEFGLFDYEETKRTYETPKMCSNIYRAIYFLVVEMGCVCHKEYTDFVKNILFYMYLFDYSEREHFKKYFTDSEHPKYVYDYLHALLYLFRHGTNIVNIQKNAITRFVNHRKQIAAAITIQRSWRNVISDPSHLVCRKRLLNEFETLVF